MNRTDRHRNGMNRNGSTGMIRTGEVRECLLPLLFDYGCCASVTLVQLCARYAGELLDPEWNGCCLDLRLDLIGDGETFVEVIELQDYGFLFLDWNRGKALPGDDCV